MIRYSCARTTIIFLCGLIFLTTLGCNSSSVTASGSGSGADLSGPPTFNAMFQARNPRVCAKVTTPPNVSQATVMVQCSYEAGSSSGGSSPVFILATDVKVEMGAPRAFMPGVDNYWQDIDPSAKVYPLRGQSTSWTCIPSNAINAGKNCQMSRGTGGGEGRCWHTQFNEWQCSMTMGGSESVLQVKGPAAY